MSYAAINLTLTDTLDSVLRVEKSASFTQQILSKLGFGIFDQFVASHIRKVAKRMAVHVIRLRHIEGYFAASYDDFSEMVDEDLKLFNGLEHVKSAALEVNKKTIHFLSTLSDSTSTRRTRMEAARLNQVIVELYETADKLQWELAEHDATVSASSENSITNSDEVEALLSRLCN